MNSNNYENNELCEVQKSRTYNKLIYLNRNLIYNKEKNSLAIVNYYIHIFQRLINIDNIDIIKSIVCNFTNQRNKKDNNTEDFEYLSSYNLKEFELPEEDKVFYVDDLICIFCKKRLKNYTALYVHYKTNHSNSIYFSVKLVNKYTNLKEAHIVSFTKKNYVNENTYCIEDSLKELYSIGIHINKYEFCFSIDEILRQTLLIEFLKEKDDFLKLISYKRINNLNSFNDYLCNKEDNSINNLNNIIQKSKKLKNDRNSHLVDINKQILNIYLPNYHSYMENRLVLLHTVTGEMLDNNLESSGYSEIEVDTKTYLEQCLIDKNCSNISFKDKIFLKIWNKFIQDNNSEISKNKFFEICKKFLVENKVHIVEYYNCIILHFINMYEFELLKRHEVIELLIHCNSIN